MRSLGTGPEMGSQDEDHRSWGQTVKSAPYAEMPMRWPGEEVKVISSPGPSRGSGWGYMDAGVSGVRGV